MAPLFFCCHVVQLYFSDLFLFLGMISSQCALSLPHVTVVVATRAKLVGVTHRSRDMIGCLLTREGARLGFVR